MIDTIKSLLIRDLNKLKIELESYTDERRMWHTEKGISNSAGNLFLHLVGNLNHFIGAMLGNTGYIRNRELEFSAKNIPRTELALKIEKTIVMVDQSLDLITEEALKNEYPILFLEEKVSTAYLLTHMVAHLNYHLGQINYHRRLLD